MPERDIDAAIEHIQNAAEEIEALVGRVEGLQTSRRRLTAALVGLAVVTALMVAGGFLLLDTVQRLDTTIEQQEADRQTTSLTACRLRNNTPAQYRKAAADDIDATAELLLDVGVDQAVVDQYVAARIAAIPTPDETDRDCDGDGELTEADYPQEES